MGIKNNLGEVEEGVRKKYNFWLCDCSDMKRIWVKYKVIF